MPARSHLCVAAVFVATLPAHGDDAVRTDGSRLTGRLTLSDAGRFRFRSGDRDEPIADLEFVRFAPKTPATPLVPLWHQVHLTRGEVILAEVRKLDEKAFHIRTSWAETIAIPRTAIERVTNPPGWRPVLFDSFDGGLAIWTKSGDPRIERGKLVFNGAGQAVEAAIKPALTAGRVAVTFSSEVTTGRRVNVELGFVRNDKPAVVRLELIAPGERFLVTAPDKPDLVRAVKRDAGAHRVSIEFDRDRLAVFVDEFVLWVRDAGPGELRSIKLVSAGEGTEAATIDSVLVSKTEPVVEPRAWADLTADAVRSPDGDETFGILSAIGPAGVTLTVKGKTLALGWPDTASFAFRRGAVTEKPTRGEHVRVRLRTVENQHDLLEGAVKAFDDRALVLDHPVLGELSLPRDRVEELRLLFHGRRVPVETSPHHLGNRPAFGFAVPKPEGLRFVKTIALEAPATGFLAIDAAHVSGSGSPVEVLVNGERVGELNRLVDRAEPIVRTYRLPIAGGRRGDNEVEVRLRPTAGGKVNGIDLRAVRLELADPR